MKIRSIIAATLIVGISHAAPALAAKCKAPDLSGEVSEADMTEFYNCIQPGLSKGYGKKGNDVATAYTGWKNASKFPAAPGVHSGQHLMTYVNEVGYDEYVKFASADVSLPVGTVIAKESFTIKSKGKWKKGPLLVMEKVGDSAADTGGWKYLGVKPNGKKLKVDGPGFCHACHQAFASQDSLGYPIEAARVN